MHIDKIHSKDSARVQRQGNMLRVKIDGGSQEWSNWKRNVASRTRTKAIVHKINKNQKFIARLNSARELSKSVRQHYETRTWAKYPGQRIAGEMNQSREEYKVIKPRHNRENNVELAQIRGQRWWRSEFSHVVFIPLTRPGRWGDAWSTSQFVIEYIVASCAPHKVILAR